MCVKERVLRLVCVCVFVYESLCIRSVVALLQFVFFVVRPIRRCVSFATTVIGSMLAKTIQSHKYALIVVMLERTCLQRSTCRKQKFSCSEWYAML